MGLSTFFKVASQFPCNHLLKRLFLIYFISLNLVINIGCLNGKETVFGLSNLDSIPELVRESTLLHNLGYYS